MKLSSIKTFASLFKSKKVKIPHTQTVITTAIRPEHKEFIKSKVTELNNWYTKVIGLDQVKLCQDRVVVLQEKLTDLQEKRREAARKLVEIRRKSNELQDELHKVKRQEDIQTFLTLMREETEILRQERDTQNEFQEHDQAEREVFTAFANAIRDSHEKQRAQLEYTKYFGIVLSILGSFLAFCYTSIRKKDLKYYFENSVGSFEVNTEELKSHLVTTDQKLTKLMRYMNDDTFQTISFIHNNSNALKSIIDSNQEWKRNPNVMRDGNVLTMTESFEQTENKYIRYALYIGLGLLICKVFCQS